MICSEGANILPEVINDTISDKLHVCDNTDEILETHVGIFINALGDTMPECDLKKGVHTSGDIKINDTLIKKFLDETKDEIRRKNISIIFQYNNLLNDFTGSENVMMP